MALKYKQIERGGFDDFGLMPIANYISERLTNHLVGKLFRTTPNLDFYYDWIISEYGFKEIGVL